MRIKRLRLENYRGTKNLELNFDTMQSVAVLVGTNGSGKSSVLDCISALFKTYSLVVNHGKLVERVELNLSALNDFFFYTSEENFHDRDIHTGRNSSCNSLSILIDKDEISWEVEKSRGIRDRSKTSQYVLGLIFKSNAERYSEEYFVSIYYSANRKPLKINVFHNSLPEDLDIMDFKEFTSWYQKLEDLENETRLSIDNNHRDIKLEATRKTIYSMLGDGFSNLRMKRAIDKLTIHKVNQEIELDWLSDGERGLLALAGDLARRLATTYPDSVNPLHEAGLVLIDEIELHLHPEWQRIIIQRLTQTFPGCQFIVTTHSPQVLSNVQPECIHILKVGELDRAKDLIQNLATEIGIDEPELIRAASTIHRREVIGR
jgi:predicted ATP-binding protein involved in virulence